MTKGPKIYSFRHFVILKADFGPFSKREEKTKIRAEIGSHGTRDSDASTSPGGGAAGVPLRTPYLHAVLRIAAAFGPRTPHILRRSCAVSLPKRALMTARSCYGPDVTKNQVVLPSKALVESVLWPNQLYRFTCHFLNPRAWGCPPQFT